MVKYHTKKLNIKHIIRVICLCALLFSCIITLAVELYAQEHSLKASAQIFVLTFLILMGANTFFLFLSAWCIFQNYFRLSAGELSSFITLSSFLILTFIFSSLPEDNLVKIICFAMLVSIICWVNSAIIAELYIYIFGVPQQKKKHRNSIATAAALSITVILNLLFIASRLTMPDIIVVSSSAPKLGINTLVIHLPNITQNDLLSAEAFLKQPTPLKLDFQSSLEIPISSIAIYNATDLSGEASSKKTLKSKIVLINSTSTESVLFSGLSKNIISIRKGFFEPTISGGNFNKELAQPEYLTNYFIKTNPDIADSMKKAANDLYISFEKFSLNDWPFIQMDSTWTSLKAYSIDEFYINLFQQTTEKEKPNFCLLQLDGLVSIDNYILLGKSDVELADLRKIRETYIQYILKSILNSIGNTNYKQYCLLLEGSEIYPLSAFVFNKNLLYGKSKYPLSLNDLYIGLAHLSGINVDNALINYDIKSVFQIDSYL